MATPEDYSKGPPWTFVGRAWYQLNLVKTRVARELIPPELNVVDFFGYTLGGMYYAEYDSSPAGKFNELVVIPGIVWNPPTSCAWASSVLVDSSEAKAHGIREVGLPSRLATFRRRQPTPSLGQGLGGRSEEKGTVIDVYTESYDSTLSVEQWRENDECKEGEKEASGGNQRPHGLLCSLRFAPGVFGGSVGGKHKTHKLISPPKLTLHLPSFSGCTPFQPDILKYTCHLQCKPRPSPLIGVMCPLNNCDDEKANASCKDVWDSEKGSERERYLRALLPRPPTKGDIQTILTSRPLVSFCFEEMVMRVNAPVPAFQRRKCVDDNQPVLSIQPAVVSAPSFAK